MRNTEYDDEDLRSNYDREMVNLVLLEAQVKHGLHRKNANFVRKFINHQKFYIKTGYGVSNEYYCDNENAPIYGMGQGLAWAGPAWIMASNTICAIKNKKCKGLILKDPLTGETIMKVQDLYVDDLSGGTNQSHDESAGILGIMKQASLNLQKHVDLVNVTGGDIALDKCWFYLVEWIFEEGEPCAKPKSDQNANLIITDPNTKNMIKIAQMDVDESHKTLGCFVNPMGDSKSAFNQIMGFAREWRDANSTSRLRTHEILKSYYANLLPKIKYRLPTYTLTFDQCECIMKAIRPTILHSMSIQEHFSKTIMEASDQYMGLNIQHLYDVMGLEKIKFFLMHVRRKDVTGKLMIMSLKYSQLECGSGNIILNMNFGKWEKLVTWTWVVSLWEYIDKGGITMDITEPIVYGKQRENDKYVMDIIVQSARLTMKEKIAINRVRQHFKVLLLSDIATFNGKRIAHRNTIEDVTKISKLNFCRQCPTQAMINIWRKKAIPILSKYLTQQNLGQWTKTPHASWNIKVSKNRQYLVVSNQCYEKCRGDRKLYREIRNRPLHHMFLERAEIRYLKNKIQLLAVWNGAIEKKSQPPAGRLMASLTTCGRKFEKIWGNWKLNPWVSLHQISTMLLKGQLVAATDGSCRVGQEAQAWCLGEKIDGNIVIKGRSPVNNAFIDANSTRPEMFGIIAVISFVAHVIELNLLQQQENMYPDLMLFTDSATSISNSKKSHYPSTRNVLETNIDAKIELSLLLKKIPIKVKCIHVRAHQDGRIDWEKMNLPTQLNTLMDEHVGLYYTKHNMKKYPHA